MKKLIILGCLLVGIYGCYSDKYQEMYPTPQKPNLCDTTTISYKNDIKTILDSKCNLVCHSATGTSIDLTDTSVLQKQTVNRDSSNLVLDINFIIVKKGKLSTHAMPQGGQQLDQCSINKITRWVHLGANCSN